MKSLFLVISLLTVASPSIGALTARHSNMIACTTLLYTASKTSANTSEIYFNLVRSLYEKNALSGEDIGVLSTQSKPINPFDIVNPLLTSEDAYAYRRAFQIILMSTENLSANWMGLQPKLKALSDAASASSLKRGQAKVQTTDIPFPIFQHNISGTGQRLRGPFDIIYRQGRPFILGQIKGKAALLDLKTEKVLQLSAKSGGGGQLTANGYFQYQGTEYLWHPDIYRIVYDFNGRKNVIGKFSILRPKGYTSVAGKVIGKPNDLRSITLFARIGNDFFRLVENDITNRQAKPKILAEFHGYGMDDFQINHISGHNILSYVHSGEDVVFFYDLDRGRAFPKISADLMGMADEANYAEVYEDQGNLRAIFPTIDKYVIADLNTGKIIQQTTADCTDHGRIRVTQVDDQLMAYAKGDDIINVIDLKTNTHMEIKAKDIYSEVIEFNFNGEKYLAWGSLRGQIGIFNLSRNNNITSQKMFQGRVEKLIPFEQNGRVYAFVEQKIGSPSVSSAAIIQLVGPAK